MYSLLDTRERLSPPGEAAKAVWVTTDATTKVAFGADRTGRAYLRQELKDSRLPLRAALGEEGAEDMEILLGESMAFVVLAGKQPPPVEGQSCAPSHRQHGPYPVAASAAPQAAAGQAPLPPPALPGVQA